MQTCAGIFRKPSPEAAHRKNDAQSGPMKFAFEMVSPQPAWTLAALLLMCFVYIDVVSGYPSGAGLTACVTLTPKHKDAPNPSEYTSPYSVEVVDDIRTYSPGKPITGRKKSSCLDFLSGVLAIKKHPETKENLLIHFVRDQCPNTTHARNHKDDQMNPQTGNCKNLCSKFLFFQ